MTLVFEQAAASKNIRFAVVSSLHDPHLPFDPAVLEKILSNLLSLVYKHTPANGQIEVLLQPQTTVARFWALTVTDTGNGTSQALFNRFVATRGSVQHNNDEPLPHSDSLGIGLEFLYSLVHFHGGTICTAEVDKHPAIVCQFPLVLEADEPPVVGSVLDHSPYMMDFGNNLLANIDEPAAGEWDSPTTDPQAKTLLVVDDDPAVLKLLKAVLSNDYVVHMATDGREGLKMALEHVPDLVISDVSMPEMDGYELCKKLKSDFYTSHIPVVLLSAKADIDFRLNGLSCGADSYIAKPFHVRQLKTEIANLIRLRQNLMDAFRKGVYSQPSASQIPSLDEMFIGKCVEIIERHIGDADFGVVELGNDIGLSRAQLFRKLKALIGQTPNEFILSTRLTRAAQLLVEKNYPVADVAYMTGFTNPGSFSTAFRRHFDMTPSQYVSDNRLSV